MCIKLPLVIEDQTGPSGDERLDHIWPWTKQISPTRPVLAPVLLGFSPKLMTSGRMHLAQTDRLFRLKHLFDSGRCLGKAYLLHELEVSYATLKRDITLLRDRMNAPIVFDPERGGYRLDTSQQIVGTQYELPGLWLTTLPPRPSAAALATGLPSGNEDRRQQARKCTGRG